MLTELIEALQILAKYDNPMYPTHCEHDVLTVLVDPGIVAEVDLAKLDALGFHPGDEYDIGAFTSYRFGSA